MKLLSPREYATSKEKKFPKATLTTIDAVTGMIAINALYEALGFKLAIPDDPDGPITAVPRDEQ